MPKASVLQFHNYEVEEMVYRAVPVSEDRHEFELRPQFDHNVIELGEGNYDVRLSFSLRPTEEYPMPFELKCPWLDISHIRSKKVRILLRRIISCRRIPFRFCSPSCAPSWQP